MTERTEIDSLGAVGVPANALYGSNTVRALENFPITDRTLGNETALVTSIAQIKKACAMTNADLGAVNQAAAQAIAHACDEMIEGALNDSLIVPVLEGSGGTSTNMNVNEVLANRALQILGEPLGNYSEVHPNDHVNCGQSTNDVVPSAIKLACHALTQSAVASARKLAKALEKKSAEFAAVYRLGRTCLQDAQPMTLGQAFEGYAAVVARAADRIEAQGQHLLTLPLGGTAVGTGLGSVDGFRDAAITRLSAITDLTITPCASRFDGMQNLDELQRLSAELETATGAVAKIAKDLILLSSGPNGGLGEITLPSVQAGSSIMPGKVNPVLPMSAVQLAQIVHGNHACIVMACQDGMLEINHYESAIASRLFDSLQRTAEIVDVFSTRCVEGIEANTERSLNHLLDSFALATTLVPRLGYSAVSQLVKDSVKAKRPFLELAEAQNLIARDEIMAIIKSSVEPDD
ncbi:MAG: lyase family protein [Pseudomonadota bacterium]